MQSLSGAVALVTGGSRGIGAATAVSLAGAGASVVITHRDSADGAAEVVESLPGSGHRVIRASATDTEALREAARTVEADYGRLDILVNNAAFTRVIPHHDLEALDDETFDKVLITNIRGPFATVRAFRRLLAADGGGLIVNITSLAGSSGAGSNVAYAASKAAMNTMTMSLARALAPEIRVLAVAPGLIDTEFTVDWDPVVRQRQIDGTPLGRLGVPEDIGRAVLAAATSLTFTTGVVIPVDGGRPLSD